MMKDSENKKEFIKERLFNILIDNLLLKKEAKKAAATPIKNNRHDDSSGFFCFAKNRLADYPSFFIS